MKIRTLENLKFDLEDYTDFDKMVVSFSNNAVQYYITGEFRYERTLTDYEFRISLIEEEETPIEIDNLETIQNYIAELISEDERIQDKLSEYYQHLFEPDYDLDNKFNDEY